jgi:hypothetical protein
LFLCQEQSIYELKLIQQPVLQNGIFSNQKSQFGKILESLQWKLFVCFMAILSTLRSNCVFCGHLVYFFHFGMLHREKSGNPVNNKAQVVAFTYCSGYCFIESSPRLVLEQSLGTDDFFENVFSDVRVDRGQRIIQLSRFEAQD